MLSTNIESDKYTVPLYKLIKRHKRIIVVYFIICESLVVPAERKELAFWLASLVLTKRRTDPITWLEYQWVWRFPIGNRWSNCIGFRVPSDNFPGKSPNGRKRTGVPSLQLKATKIHHGSSHDMRYLSRLWAGLTNELASIKHQIKESYILNIYRCTNGW